MDDINKSKEESKMNQQYDIWDDEALRWEEIETEHIVQDKWIDFRRVKYRMPDGREWTPFYNFSRRDYAVIIARDRQGRYICVRQFRHGIRKCTTEFPAGGIERSGGHDYALASEPEVQAEDALETARRELKEETGYVSDHWRHLITVPSQATISDNYAYVFAADDCEKVSGQDLDDSEFLSTVLLEEKQIEDMIRKGDFPQAVHIMGFMMLKAGY